MLWGRITGLPGKDRSLYRLRITDSPSVIYLRWSNFGNYEERIKTNALALGAVWEVTNVSGGWQALRLAPADWNIFEGEGWSKIDGRRYATFLIGSRGWAETQFAEQFPETLFTDRKLEEACK